MDTYLDNNKAYERLRDEFYKYDKLVVAVDFDGTIHDYHKKGETYNDVIGLLKQIKPFVFLVIYTVSEEDRYPYIKEYCNKIGLGEVYINQTPNNNLPKGGKLYYNILLDDRAGLLSSYETLKRLYENDIKFRSDNIVNRNS